MSKDGPSLLRASSSDWDKAWDVVSRLGAARKHLERDTGPVANGSPASVVSEREPATIAMLRARPLPRSLAVWILIGALWISIGMIVSAAIVTVAYLA